MAKIYLELDDELVEQSEDLFSNRYLLCRRAFENLYADQGFKILFDIASERPEDLKKLRIVTDRGHEIEVDSFVEQLDKFNVILP